MGRGRRGVKRQFQEERNKPTQEQLECKAKRVNNSQDQDKQMLQRRNKLRHDLRKRGPLFDPNDDNALTLYPNSTTPNLRAGEVKVVLDPRLSLGLESHQRLGVSKIYQMLSKHCNRSSERGFILADGMGLGKTVQTIAVLWTLLTQSPHWDERRNKVKAEIKKAIIVCPKSVIQVWSDQIRRWLCPSGLKDATNSTIDYVETLDDKKSGAKKKEIASNFMDHSNPIQVLILSYETFLSLSKKYQKNNKINNPLLDGPLAENTNGVVDLIILDEAHYIKNALAQRSDAITCFEVERKIALTGTPLQNNLKEYYTIINYIQENCLGDEAAFRKTFEVPILSYLEDKYDIEGKIALHLLKRKVRPFFLRRTANPFVSIEKTEYIICCKMQENSTWESEGTEIQLELYNKFVDIYSANTQPSPPKKKGEKKQKVPAVPKITALQAISFLKDLCAHPALMFGKCRDFQAKGIPRAGELLDILNNDTIIEEDIDHTQSSKLRVLNSLLLSIKNNKNNDRVVIVSYYTSTLDAIETYLDTKIDEGFHYVRFDGSTHGSKRNGIIQTFNDPHAQNQFIMTLSSRAGGCGISLTGANHLIMFDPDWNPANDEQAMSRIHREGQKKDCFIYRFMTTASIEENIFHRQIVKKLLAGAVLNDIKLESTPLHKQHIGKLSSDIMEEMGSRDTIRELVKNIEPDDLENSLTHSQLDCTRCDVDRRKELKPPKMNSTEEQQDDLQLNLWHHHFSEDTLPAECEALQDAWTKETDGETHISFVFRKNSKGVTKKPNTRHLSDSGLDLSDISDDDSFEESD